MNRIKTSFENNKQLKQILFCFLFSIAPEISSKYNKASKEEKARARKENIQLLNKIKYML